MAWSSSNPHLDISTEPEEINWSIWSGYIPDCFPFQFPSMTAESWTNHGLWNPILHPPMPQDSDSRMSPTLSRLGVNDLNVDTLHHTRVQDTSPVTLLDIDLVNPRDKSSTFTSPEASESTPTGSPQSKAGWSKKAKVKLPSNGRRAVGSKQTESQGAFRCNWKDCKYPRTFSRKGVLMRHIDTQHISPRSIDCPECGRLFNRNDNMRDHLAKIHRKRIE